MNKVITINLNGRAFQLEEHGYGQLKDYLAEAHSRLSADPDRDEILADLEQALADKCQSKLTGTKNVVLDKEVTGILHDMGPVSEAESSASDGASGAKQSDRTTSQPPKRFYLIKEHSMIGGVCTGLAAYFNFDVTVVRFVMLALAFITGGASAVGYIVAMLIAPTANTPEEKAAARGESFNSRELIDQARKKYAELSDKKHWDRVVEENRPAFSAAGATLRQVLRVIAGIISAAAILSLMALTAALVSSSLALLSTGALFGFNFTPAIQPWILGVLIGSAYVVAAVPLLFIAVDTFRYSRHGHTNSKPWLAVLGTVAVMAAITAIVTLAGVTPSVQENLRRYTEVSPGVYCIGICADPAQ